MVKNMVTKLTVESEPTGIGFQVTWNNSSRWVFSTGTLEWPSNVTVTIIAFNSVGVLEDTTPTGYRFVKWQKGGVDYTTNPKITITDTGEVTVKGIYEQLGYYPTRNPVYRGKKFNGKIDKEVYGLRVSALKPLMAVQMAKRAGEQAHLETFIGKYLMDNGIYGHMIHHYRNYSQALYGLKNRFTSETLNNEATMEAKKWLVRGLDKTHLVNIAKLMGITVSLD
jgi:hypothetical protein